MRHRRLGALALWIVVLSACDSSAGQMSALLHDPMLSTAPQGAELGDLTVEEGDPNPPTAEWMSVTRPVTLLSDAQEALRFYANKLNEQDWSEIEVECLSAGTDIARYHLHALKESGPEGRVLYFGVIIHLENTTIGELTITSPLDASGRGVPAYDADAPPKLDCLDG